MSSPVNRGLPHFALALSALSLLVAMGCGVELDVGPGCASDLRACVVDGLVSCVDLNTDAAHCGACGQVCDGVCTDGRCCAGRAPMLCGDDAGGCADLMSDPANCGRCGNVCADGACADGVCCGAELPDACPGDAGAMCVALARDANHCGACDRSCADATCLEGQCCGGDEPGICAGGCVDLANDAAHCGACGHRCVSGFCDAGRCCGDAGKQVCGDASGTRVCVDVAVNPDHCGSCGAVCSTGACEDGTCCLQACGTVCLPTRYELLSAWGGHEGLSARLIDLDGDGYDDGLWNIQIEGRIEVVWGNATGLNPPTLVPTGRIGVGVDAGDIDGDGNLDLVASIQGRGPPIADQIRIFYGDGRRGFGRVAALPQEFNPGWLTLLDANDDGHLDIVVRLMGANCTAVRLGDGAGGFADSECVIPYATPSDEEVLRAGDIDGDGKDELLDLRVVSEPALWMHRFEAGRVVSSELLPLVFDGRPHGLDMTDVDGDDIDDAVVFEFGAAGLQIRALGSRGQCTLTQNLQLGSEAPGPTENVTGAGDFDGDGRVDFIGRSTCGLCATHEYLHLGRR